MMPEEANILHGTWRIESNQYFATAQYSDTTTTDPIDTSQSTIVLITKDDFVFMDQTNIFYETRSN
jgi:hypothetical protein